MQKELEERIEEAEEFMPGVKKYLGTHNGGFFDTYFSYHTEDVNKAETRDYKVVAAKREEHQWCSGSGGIRWVERISLYAQKKGCDEIRTRDTAAIKTRDQYHATRDRQDLWGYDSVYLEVLDNNRIKVAWMDNKENLGPDYVVNLDDV